MRGVFCTTIKISGMEMRQIPSFFTLNILRRWVFDDLVVYRSLLLYERVDVSIFMWVKFIKFLTLIFLFLNSADASISKECKIQKKLSKFILLLKIWYNMTQLSTNYSSFGWFSMNNLISKIAYSLFILKFLSKCFSRKSATSPPKKLLKVFKNLY